MAELTHLYDDQDSVQTTTSGTYADITGITVTPVANTKYLIVARALFGVDSATNKGYLRVETADDTAIEAKSESIVEFERTGSTNLLSYLFVHSFTSDASPDTVTLQFKVDGSSTTTADQMSLFLLDLDAIGTEGTDYYEDIQAVSGDEYSITAATTVLAQLAGSDLTTVEHLILGYARADIGSTGRWFDHSLHAAYDTSTAAERSLHRAEGEDTAEQRIGGFAIRHKASSGTPNVTLYGTEEAANGNMLDGGAYLIALPTSLFADFVDDYEAGDIDVGGTEITIATTGSYTPTITGNHLVFGRSNGFDTPAGLAKMWVESTTTEIRTGDEPPLQTQSWDNTKDLEQVITFQRYSITTAETFNLRGDGSGGFLDLEHRWLIVVNLNPPSTGDATANLTTIQATVTIDAPTTTTSASITTTAVNTVATLTATTQTVDASATLTAVNALVTLTTVATTTSNTATLTAVNAVVTLTAPTTTTSATINAAAVNVVVTLDQPAVTGGATVTLTAVQAIVTSTAPATTATATANTTAVNAVVTIDTVDAQGGVGVTLTTINAVVTLTATTQTASATANLTAINAIVTLTATTQTASATANLTTVNAVVTLDQPAASSAHTVGLLAHFSSMIG